MSRFFTVCVLFFSLTASAQSFGKDSISLRQIFDFYLTESQCYKNLGSLCHGIGSRLSGSPQAAQAVLWAKKAMYEAGADTVYLQPCICLLYTSRCV